MFEGGVAFWNLTSFTPLSAPPEVPGDPISYPNRTQKRIGLIIIYIKFDQNQMKTVEVCLVKC